MRVLVVLALVLAAPVAAAQVPTHFPTSLEITVHALEAPIGPGSEPMILTGLVRYSHFSPVPPVEPVHVNLSVVERPEWATVVVDPPVVTFDGGGIVLDGGTTRSYETSFSVLVTVGADAPAFEPATVRVAATAPVSTPYGGSMTDEAFLVTARYAPLLDVDPATAHVPLERGETREVGVTVANLGNGPTRVEFRLVDAPDGVEVELPVPVVVPSRFEDDAERHVRVRVRAPGAVPDGERIVVHAVPAYALDPSLKDPPAAFELVLGEDGGVRLQSVRGDAESPAPVAVGVLGALAGLGVAWSRR